MNDRLALTIELEPGLVAVTVVNHDAERALVWSRANSWGWPTVTLRLAPSGQPDEWVVLHPPARTFTRNGPGVVEIPGDGHHRLELRPGQEAWVTGEPSGWLHDEDLVVWAVLDIPASPEAGELGVAVGQWQSPPVRSHPPHRWW